MRYVYPAIFSPSDEGYAIWFPDLPGTNSQGANWANSIDNARNALGSWLDYLDDKGMEIPSPSKPSEIALDGPDDIITLIDVDLDSFRRANDNRAVKKTLTIPAWMDEKASSMGINFSRALQEALQNKFDDAV